MDDAHVLSESFCHAGSHLFEILHIEIILLDFLVRAVAHLLVVGFFGIFLRIAHVVGCAHLGVHLCVLRFLLLELLLHKLFVVGHIFARLIEGLFMFEGFARTCFHLRQLLLLACVGLLRIGGKVAYTLSRDDGLRNILYGVGNTHTRNGRILDAQLFR